MSSPIGFTYSSGRDKFKNMAGINPQAIPKGTQNIYLAGDQGRGFLTTTNDKIKFNSLPVGPSLAALGGTMAVSSTNGILAGPDLSKQQEAMLLFERIPIVWTRRVGDTGGVLIAPKATECRFDTPALDRQLPYLQNGDIKYKTQILDIPNAVKVKYHVVLSEGKIGGIQVRDVFQGRCRVGQFSQSYSKRAGQWTPGNFLIDVYRDLISYMAPNLVRGTHISNLNTIIPSIFANVLLAKAVPAPTVCGTTGTYEGLSTFSFSTVYLNGDDVYGSYDNKDDGFWKRQIHIFVRNGAQTTRLIDNTYGSSNNLADLYLWLLTRNGRTPEQQIDRASLLTAARFMDANGLFWNGVLSEPTSLSDWINTVGRYFLVREAKVGGRYGLRPLLPVTLTGAINTGALTPDWVFDSNAIEPGSYSLTFRDAESRRPFRAEMAWRQQGDDGLSGITRSTPVYYVDTPGYAPIEEHNLTQFCTSEIHAVRAGMFEQAKRRWSTHAARVTVVPGAYDNRLGEGDLIALQLDREDLDGVNDPVREWYSVTSLSAGREGRIILDLEHFPVDSQGRSLIALDVVNATAAGDLFITGDSGPSCDEDPSRATDTSIPAEDALSRTKEEVYFYNKNGRFPNNNEYIPQPNPPQKPSKPSQPSTGTSDSGGGGGSALPPSKTATTANNPYGPEVWPGLPDGCAIECKLETTWGSSNTAYVLPAYIRRVCKKVCASESTPGPTVGDIAMPATRSSWYLIMEWKSGIDESSLTYDEQIITFAIGTGYCHIAGTSGSGSGLTVNVAKVDTANNVTAYYQTQSLGTGGIGQEFQGASLWYRDPDNANSPPIRSDGVGNGLF